jgi:hypothetical protein
MPTPEEYNEYVSMDMKLSAVHQQFITSELAKANRLLTQHDQEIMVLAIMVIVVSGLLGYVEYRLRRIEGAHNKGTSIRVSETKNPTD